MRSLWCKRATATCTSLGKSSLVTGAPGALAYAFFINKGRIRGLARRRLSHVTREVSRAVDLCCTGRPRRFTVLYRGSEGKRRGGKGLCDGGRSARTKYGGSLQYL